jgi:tetratricopeptide (TPR) repeat protein
MEDDPVTAAVTMLHQNRPAEALALFNQALARFNAAASQERASFGKAVALHLLGRLDEAEQEYLRRIDLAPNDEILANLIALAVEKFDLPKVEQYSLRLLESNPESIVAWQGLLVVAMERRDLESAAEYFAHIDGRTPAPDDRAIQYRLTGHMADKLRGLVRPVLVKGTNGSVARSR